MKRLLMEAVEGIHSLIYGPPDEDEKDSGVRQKTKELLPWVLLIAFVIFLAVNGAFK